MNELLNTLANESLYEFKSEVEYSMSSCEIPEDLVNASMLYLMNN